MTETFTGTLRLDDMQRHLPHAVDVPPGTAEIAIAFDYDPKHPGEGPIPHELSLSIWGPAGGRGARHNNPDFDIRIGEHAATPGFEKGKVEPGTWTIYLDTHRIQPPGGITYRLAVTCLEAPSLAPEAHVPATTRDRGPGWYVGDLHGHTYHSDAAWDVPAYLAHQKAQGLDFTTLTDHNTVSGLPELQSLADDEILTLGGVELTTFRGHCLALGPRTFRDWRVPDGMTMARRAAEHIEAGAFFVIAHPMSHGHPWCSGCNWQYTDMMPGSAHAVEIWNGPWGGDSNNELSLALYYQWLNEGHRVHATAGSDTHGPWPEGQRPGYNVVGADAFTEDAIWAALRRGHAYLSSGPRLLATVTRDGVDVPMGGVVPPGGSPGRLSVSWGDVPDGARLRRMTGSAQEDAVRAVERPVEARDGETEFEVSPDAAWALVELRGQDDSLLAITNPIFFST